MFERHYKENSRFVLSKVTGEVNDAALCEHVIAFFEEPGGNQGFLELADCRGITNTKQLTVEGCIRAARLEKECWRSKNRMLAILVSTELHYGFARAYATISSESRSATNVFYQLQDALAWLKLHEPVSEIMEFIQSR